MTGNITHSSCKLQSRCTTWVLGLSFKTHPMWPHTQTHNLVPFTVESKKRKELNYLIQCGQLELFWLYMNFTSSITPCHLNTHSLAVLHTRTHNIIYHKDKVLHLQETFGILLLHAARRMKLNQTLFNANLYYGCACMHTHTQTLHWNKLMFNFCPLVTVNQ